MDTVLLLGGPTWLKPPVEVEGNKVKVVGRVMALDGSGERPAVIT